MMINISIFLLLFSIFFAVKDFLSFLIFLNAYFRKDNYKTLGDATKEHLLRALAISCIGYVLYNMIIARVLTNIAIGLK